MSYLLWRDPRSARTEASCSRRRPTHVGWPLAGKPLVANIVSGVSNLDDTQVRPIGSDAVEGSPVSKCASLRARVRACLPSVRARAGKSVLGRDLAAESMCIKKNHSLPSDRSVG